MNQEKWFDVFDKLVKLELFGDLRLVFRKWYIGENQMEYKAYIIGHMPNFAPRSFYEKLFAFCDKENIELKTFNTEEMEFTSKEDNELEERSRK